MLTFAFSIPSGIWVQVNHTMSQWYGNKNKFNSLHHPYKYPTRKKILPITCQFINHLYYLHAARSNSPHQLIAQRHWAASWRSARLDFDGQRKVAQWKNKRLSLRARFVLGRTLRSLQLILTVGILISTQPIYLQLSFFPLLKFSSSSVGNWGAGDGRQWEELAAKLKTAKSK